MDPSRGTRGRPAAPLLCTFCLPWSVSSGCPGSNLGALASGLVLPSINHDCRDRAVFVECRAEAVLFFSDVFDSWVPLLQSGMTRPTRLAEPRDATVFVQDYHRRCEEPFVYHSWAMMAALVYFSGVA